MPRLPIKAFIYKIVCHNPACEQYKFPVYQFIRDPVYQFDGFGNFDVIFIKNVIGCTDSPCKRTRNIKISIK